MKTILLLTLTLLLYGACDAPPSETKLESTRPDTPSDSILFNLADPDSSMFPKAVVTEAYCRAIAEYAKAAYSDGKSIPDTLFIGTTGVGFQFPSIELPATISGVNVRLLSSDEAERLHLERKSYVFLNMVGWMEGDKAEFIIVTFFAGGKPQHDCHLHFVRSGKGEFELDSLRFAYAYPDNEMLPSSDH